jgi:hypothetical protein
MWRTVKLWRARVICATMIVACAWSAAPAARDDTAVARALGADHPGGAQGVHATSSATAEPSVAGRVPTYKLIVSSHDNNRIIRYEWPGGDAVDHLVAEGMSPLMNPLSLTLGPDNLIYVPSDTNNMVFRYQAQTGKPEGIFVEIPFQFGPFHIIFDAAGLAYISGDEQVYRYNTKTGAFVDVFVDFGSGGLDRAVGMTFGPDGDLFVASYNNDRVLRYDGETGNFKGAFVTPGSGGLDGPVGLLFTDDGVLLVSSENSDSVLQYSATNGAFLGACITPLRGGLDGPRWIRFGPDGNLYVANRAVANNVLRFSYPGCELLGAAVPSNLASLDGPTDVLFIPDPDPTTCPQDVNSDGTVDGTDLGLVLAGWGECPEPEER